MTRITCWLAVLVLLGGGVAVGQEPVLSGLLRLDRRVSVGGDSVVVADFYNRFEPRLRVAFESGMYLSVSGDLRFYDFPGTRQAQDLESADRHFPMSATMWEAYVLVPDLFLSGLDVTIGKQRITWGTADKLNPTDQLNAYDFSDLTDFTARIPTWAVRAEYYLGETRIEGVWEPVVHPPLLPQHGAQLFLGPSTIEAPDGSVVPLDSRILPSPRGLGDGTVAIKVARYVAGLDLSFSYFDGYDGLPLPQRMVLTDASSSAQSGGWSAEQVLAFPRRRAIGADFATEKGGVGLWGEAALVFPSEATMTAVTVTGPDSVTSTQVVADGRTYVQSTVGLDYTFGGGWYVNAQWAHGLFFERGARNLHDYLVGRFEKELLRGDLKLALTGTLELAQWRDIVDNAGFGVVPEVTYTPVNDLALIAGAFVLSGRGASLFGAWGNTDQVYVRTEVRY